MIGIAVFNVFMVVLGLLAASPVLRRQWLSNLLGYLHNIIGITTPVPEKVRLVVVIWIVSLIVLVDGLLFLLVLLTSISG